MPGSTFACPKCEAVFNVEPGFDHLEAICPNCTSDLDTYFFPALFRAPRVGLASLALSDSAEASCFYHPQKQAAHVCDGCGRLICALCSIELGQENLCPNCISTGRKKGKITTLEIHRKRYDSIAMSLAVFGLLFYLGSIVLAPVAIYISIRHWNSPGSLLGVSRKRFIIAIALSVLELGGWIAFATMLIVQSARAHS